MLIGRFLLIFSTLIAFRPSEIKSESANGSVDGKLIVIPIKRNFPLDDSLTCPKRCSIDQCGNPSNCTKLIREPCDCCNVCLRDENEICGGSSLSADGLCDENLLCYRSNRTFHRGLCVKACRKLQCLLVEKLNRTICECSHRRVPCDERLDQNRAAHCYNQTDRLKFLQMSSSNLDCSKIICQTDSNPLSSFCPSDSHWIVDQNISKICCHSAAFCSCSSCPKTICKENSILQIYRTGDPLTPGQCCDQYHCVTKSKQCYHDKKIYNENEKWSIDDCTECICQEGHVDCRTTQCPTYTHCGYMYKPENECCPVCGGCLNDRFHVQHMNSTWMESNGCMKCWCEDGRSRCVVEGCIAPPCENPRQIANVCCPVCADDDRPIDFHLEPIIHRCPPFVCDKHCPYNYTIDTHTGCPQCQCNSCPPLNCIKNCTYGLKQNELGCPLCICESQRNSSNRFDFPSWPRQCQTGSLSYSNGEIWFDGCRQCLCYKGQIFCALISCPILKCTQPILLPNRCCPTCPGSSSLLAEPIPASQVCYASQSVTGEELEFDKCTKCICLDNMAFCSISICPPLSCSTPIYDASLCCPICPPTTDIIPNEQDLTESNEDEMCQLENGLIKHTGEVWKQDDCQSCLCPRFGQGKIQCFSQICPQHLPCQNPVLKKGQCCPFCLPSTAAVPVCIFNYIQYRSGEHWNVTECHHCKCLLGTIVCHQHQCPSLTCIRTITLPGHCCPICRDLLLPDLDTEPNLLPSSPLPTRFSVSIVVVFSILISVLLFIILILLIFLARGRQRTITSASTFNAYHLSADSKSSIIGTNTTGTRSSNPELEPIRWPDEDESIFHSSTSSSVPDDQDLIQIVPRTSTIIYV